MFDLPLLARDQRQRQETGGLISQPVRVVPHLRRNPDRVSRSRRQ